MVKEENTIYVGKKPVAAYIQAIIASLTEDTTEVEILARGGNINRAVDVAESATKRFLTDFEISDISTDTEEIKTEEGTRRVSAIKIKLSKS